jgi:hypothetical protein
VDIISALGIGVISSLLSLLFAGVIGTWIRNVVIPWLEERAYRGVRISGEWRVFSQTAQEAVLDLKQSAQRITGTCTFIAQLESDHFELARQFRVDGRIIDRLVRLSFDHVDPSRLGFGVFLAEVIRDGRKMLGVQAYYSVTAGRIDSCRCAIVRPGVPAGEVMDLRTFRTLGEGPILNKPPEQMEFESDGLEVTFHPIIAEEIPPRIPPPL